MRLKKDIIDLYIDPPKHAVALCSNKNGPLSVRPYLGSSWTKSGYSKRLPATYRRTEPAVQIVAAFNPHNGKDFAKCYDVENYEIF